MGVLGFFLGLQFEFIAVLAAVNTTTGVNSIAFKICIASAVVATLLISASAVCLLFHCKPKGDLEAQNKSDGILMVLEKVRLICAVIAVIGMNVSLICRIL